MNREDLKAVALWDRLPSRPLESREIAAALPDPVTGDYVAAYAPVPDGVDLDFHGFEVFVVESSKWHYVALTARDGTLEVDGEVVEPGDELYDEIVAKRWRREESVGPSPEFSNIEDALRGFESVSGLRAAVESAGNGSKQIWERVALNHAEGGIGRECKRGRDGGFEKVSDELAEDLRRELYEERMKEAEKTEAQRRAAQARAEGQEYVAFTSDARLDPSHGAVERTAKWLGVAPEDLATVGDLPDAEDVNEPENGILGYDGEQVLEYSGMTGWEPVNSASFLADGYETARASDEALLGDVAASLASSEETSGTESVGALATAGEREQAVEELDEGANENAVVTDVEIAVEHSHAEPTATVDIVVPTHPNEVEFRTVGSARCELYDHEVQRAVGSTEPQAHTSTVVVEGPVEDVAHSVQLMVGEDETPDMLAETAATGDPTQAVERTVFSR